MYYIEVWVNQSLIVHYQTQHNESKHEVFRVEDSSTLDQISAPWMNLSGFPCHLGEKDWSEGLVCAFIQEVNLKYVKPFKFNF